MTATATKTAKKNTGRFILAKQQLWTCIMIFGTFLYSYCSTIIATWNYLISSAGFMEKVNKTQKCSFSFTKLWYSPFGFNSRKFLQTFDKFNETKKDFEVWTGVNFQFLRDVYGLLPSRNSATMAMWRNDFYSLWWKLLDISGTQFPHCNAVVQ